MSGQFLFNDVPKFVCEGLCRARCLNPRDRIHRKQKHKQQNSAMKRTPKVSLVTATFAAIGTGAAFADDQHLQNRLALQRQEAQRNRRATTVAVYAVKGIGQRSAMQDDRSEARLRMAHERQRSGLRQLRPGQIARASTTARTQISQRRVCANRLVAATPIPFQFRDGLIWLKVAVAGKSEPLNFLLDSRARRSSGKCAHAPCPGSDRAGDAACGR